MPDISNDAPPAAQRIALALGSNLGDRMGALREAAAALRPFVQDMTLSPVYETPPAYATDQPSFLNAALTGTTALPPLALLWTLKQLEAELGRQPSFRYGPRRIDIDILFYGDAILHTPELTVPHAHMAEREFVLRPLADIAPGWRHPETGLTVAAMLNRLSRMDAVRVDVFPGP